MTSRTPGVRDFDGKLILVKLRRVRSDQAGKPLASRVDEGPENFFVLAADKLLPGQEILSTEQDHIVTQRSLKYRSERAGTLVRTISLYERSDTVTEEQMIEAILRALTPRTR